MRNTLLHEESHLTQATDPDRESFLPLLAAAFHILLTLAEEERHGYGIKQEVKFRTNGQFI